MGWRFDPGARVLWQPEWMGQNVPRNSNQVKGMATVFNDIPECSLKHLAHSAILRFLQAQGCHPEEFHQLVSEPGSELVSEPDPESASEPGPKQHEVCFETTPDPDPAPAPAPDPAPAIRGLSTTEGSIAVEREAAEREGAEERLAAPVPPAVLAAVRVEDQDDVEERVSIMLDGAGALTPAQRYVRENMLRAELQRAARS